LHEFYCVLPHHTVGNGQQELSAVIERLGHHGSYRSGGISLAAQPFDPKDRVEWCASRWRGFHRDTDCCDNGHDRSHEGKERDDGAQSSPMTCNVRH
jgi:hypothetical protein